MTEPLRPRALSWQGIVSVDALWLDPALLGEAEVRRRVLSLWTPGCVVDRLDGGILLRFPAPRRMDSRFSPGGLLCRAGRILWAAPLSAAERARLQVPPGTVVRLRGGVAQATPLSEGEHLDPSDWLDTRAWRWAESQALGLPPPPPAPAPEAPDIRARLGVIPAEEVRALFGAVSSAADDPRAATVGGKWGWSPSGMAAGALRATRGWMGQAANAVGTRWGGFQGLLHQGERWLDDLAERMGVLDALQRLADQQGARHLRSLLGMFDRGSTDDALRHALPLTRSGRGEGEASSGALAAGLSGIFGWGGERSFGFSEGTRRVSPLTLGERLFARLEALYRAAVVRLEAEGKHREAAYVLAELLDAPEEAVDYLEKHGEYALAAELAEARRMDLSRIAQLWLKAGNSSRVLLMLRLTDRFADTVKRLEDSGDAEGATWLRRRWALYLSHAGRFGAAAEVLWPVEAAREQALGWLDQAIGLRGASGAQSVGRKLALRPDLVEEVAEQIRPYLRGDALEDQVARIALARALVSVPATVPLARPLLRRLLLQQAAASLPGRWEALRALAAVVDPALDADLPGTISGSAATLPLETFTVPAEDTGTRPVADAGMVRGGRLLVALGEGGCLLLGSDGRPEHHFTAPTSRLVLAESGAVALALIARGAGWRVSRLDLAARRETLWLEGVRLDTFATAYDGDLWFLGIEGALVAVDAQSPTPQLQVLWSSPPLARLRSVHWSPRLVVAVGESRESPAHLEHHRYTLPGPTPHQAIVRIAADPGAGEPVLPLQEEVAFLSRAEGALVLATARGRIAMRRPPPAPPLRLLHTHPVQNLFAVALPGEVQVLQRTRAPASTPPAEDYASRFRLTSPDTTRWQVRIAEDTWVFSDDRGRVVCVRADGPHLRLQQSVRV